MSSEPTTEANRGKFTRMLDALRDQPGIIVTPDEQTTARVREGLPDRDVRLDLNATPGAIIVWAFENLPLHLYIKAEARRARS